MANFYEEFLDFIHTERFRDFLLENDFCITVEMLDFMLTHKGIQNRLALFLSKIKIDKIQNKCEKLNFTFAGFFVDNLDDEMDSVEVTKERLFSLFTFLIYAEVHYLSNPIKINKKCLHDLERLQKIQKEIIEKYYFKDTISKFLSKIGADREYASRFLFEAAPERNFTKEDIDDFLCSTLSDILDGQSEDKPCFFFNLKARDKQAFLACLRAPALIPLLSSYSYTASEIRDIKYKIQTPTKMHLEIIEDRFGFGLKYEIGRNEFQNAVKDSYEEYLKNQQKHALTKKA